MAEKKFGVRDLEIIDPSGTPTIETTGDLAIKTGIGSSERLILKDNGRIEKGSPNTTLGKQPVNLYFENSGSQMGRCFQQGTGTVPNYFNIANVSAFKSANSHVLIYVTVHYLSSDATQGGKMEAYATIENNGNGSVGTGQGGFIAANAGTWGTPPSGVNDRMGLNWDNPGNPWAGSILRIKTFRLANIEYRVDTTYIAYEGATVSFYDN